MEPLYLHFLKHHTHTNIQWYKVFSDWNKQTSNIIELKLALKSIYMSDYTFKLRELCAWRALLKAAGCFNVTSYPLDDQLVMYSLITIHNFF